LISSSERERPSYAHAHRGTVILGTSYGCEACLEFQPEDGLLSIAIKTIFGSEVWRFWYNVNVPLILRLQRRWRFSGDARRVGVLLRRAVDWHILLMTIGVVIAFATFYVVASWCGNDSFSGGTGSLVHSPVTPLYYSVVTIATIGYGDFSPQRTIGNFLVCLEIMLSFLLVVIVFQRAISESLSAREDDVDTRG
jgi:hypothetical protein